MDPSGSKSSGASASRVLIAVRIIAIDSTILVIVDSVDAVLDDDERNAGFIVMTIGVVGAIDLAVLIVVDPVGAILAKAEIAGRIIMTIGVVGTIDLAVLIVVDSVATVLDQDDLSLILADFAKIKDESEQR
jgi:hypothetical protein